MDFWKAQGRWYLGWLTFISGPVVGLVAIFILFKNVVVRDWVFLALIVALFLAVIHVGLYIHNLEKTGDRKERSSDRLKPSRETMFILATLIKNASRYLERGTLTVLFEKQFEGKGIPGFNAAISILNAYGLIRYSDPPINQEGIHITDIGAMYFDKHKGQFKKW